MRAIDGTCQIEIVEDMAEARDEYKRLKKEYLEFHDWVSDNSLDAVRILSVAKAAIMTVCHSLPLSYFDDIIREDDFNAGIDEMIGEAKEALKMEYQRTVCPATQTRRFVEKTLCAVR